MDENCTTQYLNIIFWLSFMAHSTAWRNFLQWLFHFKNHQIIFLSSEAECSWSRVSKNWTRKYSTEQHCLDLHNHSFWQWEKTYILYACMKSWEHLIKLTAVKLKNKAASIQSLMFISQWLWTLKDRDQQAFQDAGASGGPCQALGTLKKEDQGRE